MPPTFLHAVLIRYIRAGNHPAKLRLLRAAQSWLRGLHCPVRPDVTLALDYGDWLQHELLCGRDHEPLTLACLEHLLFPGALFVDVGANIGLFSLLASRKVGPTGRVIAVEPNPVALRRLRQNLALNPTLAVEVIEAAASDHVGEVALTQPDDWNLGGTCVSDTGTTRVRCAPMAELLVPFRLARPPDVIKIDVEGHEPAVIRGLFATPGLRPRHIVFEFKPSFFPLADPENALWRPLRTAGYAVSDLLGQPFTDSAPEDSVWAALSEPPC